MNLGVRRGQGRGDTDGSFRKGVFACGCLLYTSQAFVEAGGQVIFMGEPAKYMDAVPSTVPAQIAAQAARIPFDRTALMEMLEPVRQLDIRTESGARSNRYIYQMRTDAEGKWLFIANGKKAEKQDRPLVNQINILLKMCIRDRSWTF